MRSSIASSFPDRPAARAALEILVADGVPRERIALHADIGLFDRPGAPVGAPGVDPVCREAAVLSVDLSRDATLDIDHCEQLLRRAGAVRVAMQRRTAPPT